MFSTTISSRCAQVHSAGHVVGAADTADASGGRAGRQGPPDRQRQPHHQGRHQRGQAFGLVCGGRRQLIARQDNEITERIPGLGDKFFILKVCLSLPNRTIKF